MRDLPVCTNCHTYSSNGRIFAMDMDYGGDKGAFVLSSLRDRMIIKKKDIFSWNELPPLEPASYSMGLFARLSPSGRYLAATVSETSVFVMMEDLFFSQLFFPSTGQIAIFDRKTNQYKLLPGASRPDMVQTSPEWSPDGKTLAFAAVPVNPELVAQVLSRKVLNESPRQKIDVLNKEYEVHFDIFTVPFCEGKGGKAKPLPGASNNGYSNYFPRYSPNGRWMVFAQSPTGLVLQTESRLCIAPANGGNAHPLECNMPVMNSWHSWSPNSKWLVFTCKANSPYTELYLTHIDDQGKSSPAVRLFRFSSNELAAMVPEFISLSAPLPEYLNLDSPEQAKGVSMATDGR